MSVIGLFSRPVSAKHAANENRTGNKTFIINRSSNATDEEVEYFKRLSESLRKGVSEISVDVSFSINVMKHLELELNIEGVLQLECQRCMNSVALPIQQMTRYVLLDNEAALKALDNEVFDNDKFETLLLPAPESSDLARIGEIDLVALVEDELLLSVPLYPKHEQLDDCSSEALGVELIDADLTEVENESDSDSEKKTSPFAGLDKLLKH